MNNKTQNRFKEIHFELEEQIKLVAKEATRVLNNYHTKHRLCLNSGNLEDENLLAIEAEWSKKDQTLKTLKQIHKVLKNNRIVSGVYDTEAIDRELMSYTILSVQKELDDIAKLFASYREKLFN